jgi:hypothetical protein
MEVSGRLHAPAALHLFDRRVGGPQSRSGRSGEEKNFHCSCQELNPGRPVRSLVITVTELPCSPLHVSETKIPSSGGSFAIRPTGNDGVSLHHRVQTGSGAHPASYPRGTEKSYPGIHRPGREAHHSPPSSPEVKNVGELYLHFCTTGA